MESSAVSRAPQRRAPVVRVREGIVLLACAAGVALAACGRSSAPEGGGSYDLRVDVQGDGDVESMPSGIDCSGGCAASYAAGRTVTLLATPAGDGRFAGWDGDCSGTQDCVLTMDAPRHVVARFAPPPAAAPAGEWRRGDLHVHDDHSSDGSFPRQVLGQGFPGNNPVSAQIGEAARVGLDFVMLTDHRTYDQQYDPLWTSDQLLLIPGEEANGSPHATVHGAVDSIVQGANPDGAPDFYNVQLSVWDAHSQDAVWVTAHPDDGEMNDDGTPNVRANAQGIDLVEAWNRASDPDRELDYCENRWNAGYRFGIAGGSDDHFVELWAVAGPGTPNTRAYAASPSERGVLDALRRGRTSLTPSALAPVVTLEADLDGDGVYEAIGGDEVNAPSGTAGRLRIRVQNGIGDTVLLYRSPGRSAGALQTFHPTQLDQSFELDIVAPDAPQWYRAEVRGVGLSAGIDLANLTDPAALLATLTLFDQLRAIASPVFIGPAPAQPQTQMPLPADIGEPDGARRMYGPRGRWSGFADVAAAEGVAHLVAETHEPTASRVVYRRLGTDGEWQDAAAVLSGDSTTARFPRIAARGAQLAVAWQDESAGQVPRRPGIRLRRSADGGASWGPIETVRDAEGRAEHPALALDEAGRPVLAWQEIGAGAPFDIYVQTLGLDAAPQNLSREGKTVDAGNPLDSRSARYPASVWPALAIAPDGRLAVAWQDDRDDVDPLWTGATGRGEGTDPDDWQIVVRTRAAGRADWDAPRTLGAADAADRHPALAFAGDGTLVAAWDRKALQSSGANLSIQSASLRGDGDFDAPQTLAARPEAMGQYPRLGVDPDGRVRAVWYDSRAADWRWRVMTARLETGGWDAGRLLVGPGINTWPATSGGWLAFASTRKAARPQRDRTQQIYVLKLSP